MYQTQGASFCFGQESQTRAWKGSWVCPWGQLVLVIEDLRQKGRTGGLCPFSTPWPEAGPAACSVRAKCAAGEGCPFLPGVLLSAHSCCRLARWSGSGILVYTDPAGLRTLPGRPGNGSRARAGCPGSSACAQWRAACQATRTLLFPSSPPDASKLPENQTLG